MYPLTVSRFALLLSVIPTLGLSSGIIPSIARRQDSTFADLQLLGDNTDCYNFNFNGNAFEATCVSVSGTPATSKINIDACITNDNGNMVYRSEWVSISGGYFDSAYDLNRGGAFSSCSGCTLNSNLLDLICNCATGSGGFRSSTINLGKQKSLGLLQEG